MKRLEDWQSRLAEAIAAKQGVPFAWGENDCVTMAADIIEAITGEDPIADLRGKWTDARSAKAMGSPEEMLEGRGLAERPVLFAQRGDLVIWDGEHGPTFGIIDTHGIRAVFPGADGIIRVPVLACRRAWRVG